MKYGIVSEGGGMRGAYTAGVLRWLLENDINFDNASSISATAVLMAYYVAEDKEALERLGVELMSDKHNVGWRPVVRELQLLGYHYMFNNLIKKKVPLNIENIRKSKTLMQLGVYCKETHELIWVDNKTFDDELKYLKATVLMPVAGRCPVIDGKHYMDGGVMTMMPIFHSMEFKNDRYFCITTKHASYVREPNGKFLSFVIDVLYHRYPRMRASIKDRVKTYYDEMGKIDELIKEGRGILMRPSRLLPVSRLSASKEDLAELYKLGYQDCEDRKEEIYKFMGKTR